MDSLYVSRILKIDTLLAQRSLFLFGPRQTGKSTYVTHQLGLSAARVFNLLDKGLYARLSADPTRMRQEIVAHNLRDCLVVVEEIQKCPQLLDEVHLLIEERNIRFLLTGSSARSLKRAGTNLLGGRARDRTLHPFVFPEVRLHDFSLKKAFYRGLIPYHYFSQDPDEDLRSYVGRYLSEEIAAEGISRNIPAFSRFLEVAALCNSQMLNYTGVASDAQINRTTVVNYFQILKDTLLGFELAPYTDTVKRKAISTPKFYLFDLGVVRALRGLGEIEENSADFGAFFEHFLFCELRAYIDYMAPATALHYWRSKSGAEVDFILGKKIAIETKTARNLAPRDFAGLRALKEENQMEKLILVCREPERRLVDGILVMPWEEFLSELWDGTLLINIQ